MQKSPLQKPEVGNRKPSHSHGTFVSLFSALWDMVLDNTICGKDLVFLPVSLNQYESFGQRVVIFFVIFILKSPRPILLSIDGTSNFLLGYIPSLLSSEY